MKVAIHQPHYLPWLGYLDKMAKSDTYIVLDDVQLTDRSPMLRNRLLPLGGEASFLSVSVQKHGYREKRTREIELSDWTEVRRKHLKFLELNYKKTPYFDEIMPFVEESYAEGFATLLELDLATMNLMRMFFGIEVPLVLQSSLDYDDKVKNSDLMLSLCQAVNADVYLSGNGAKKYMDDESFVAQGIRVLYQNFEQPTYAQYRQDVFVPNLSALDICFQLGMQGARKVFWENMKSEDELHD